MSIRTFYDRWPQYDRRLRETVGALTDEQLAIRPGPDHFAIWGLVGHIAGTRVYWLCRVLGEPGADSTPWPTADVDGWEDDPSHPRSAAELVGALDSTFAIIDRLLDRWTPEMLTEEFERWYRDERQVHTRTSVLQRLLTHEAYHGGEISQSLGLHGLDPVYIWRAY